eukprot:CAMPEP_0113578310 /NCGR_PEP_ID=MMETSP0015_2-20120614/29402_1 /TAXON_ID=2838 /ORGANISM="Odontella" /LENGTH=765 /DNA_ID=CAMNT_0000482085 /DNA_START=135 /DNA_END=2432 /DNA_ORIENTATION=- /assembly_acc=CAM_ASM_000160
MSGEVNPTDATYTASSFEPTPGYTQTRYDPSTMSRTDVDVVMEDIEQQLSLRPADDRGSVSRDRKLLCAVALLVAVAASVGVSLSRRGNVAPTEAAVTLAAPPDYITSVCSPDMIALGRGRDKCEELCEVAVCCFVEETDKVSCIKNNEGVCEEYVAVCGNLDVENEKAGESGSGEGTADDAIKDEGGAIGPEGNDAAEQVVGDAGSTADSGNVAETDDLKFAIDSSCKDDVISLAGGEAACEALCGPGSCCFSGGGQSCESEWSNVDCGEYAACAVIFTSDSTAASGTAKEVTGDNAANTETSKAEVDSKCKGGATKTPAGLEQCQNICEQASCCFAHGEEYCLNAGLDVNCVHFSACEILHRGEYDDDDDDVDDTTAETPNEAVSDNAAETETSKEEVDSKCKGGATKTPEGLEQCQNICEQAACCFAHGPAYCLNAGLDVDCVHFSACDILHRGEDDDDDDNDELDDGDPKSTTTTTTTTAESVAVDGSAADGGGGGSTNAGGDSASAGNTLPTKAQIDESCLQDLTDYDWKVTCEELCLPGKCCFDAPQSTCGEDQGGIDCALFSSCSRVYEGGARDSVKDVLAEACSDSALAMPPGEEICREACEGSECCFSDPGTCTSLDCSDYSLCSAVFGDGTNDKVEDERPKEEGEDAQPRGEGEGGTDTGEKGDESAAAEQDTGAAGGNGGANRDEDDDLATAENVIAACSSDKLQSDRGREGCEKLCINHLCCFATENDCKGTLGTECLVYAACEALVEWSNEP